LCRRRQRAIEEAAIAASSVYRTMTDSAPAITGSRDRLRSRLAQETQENPRLWNVGIAAAVVASRRAFAWTGATAVVAMMAWLSASTGPDAARVFRTADLGTSLPISSMTPGATWDVSAADLCAGTRHTRPITEAMRAQVVHAYRMQHVASDQYELDYLITPELGGATDARNLWPQAYGSPVWNARVKDELENLLPRLVCSGQLDLQTAQRDMAVDWIAAYKKYFHTDHPLQSHLGPPPDDEEVIYALADGRPQPAVRLVSLAVR
jgi:hypothetical protein